jgi:thiamine pyrophosphokinase
MANTINKIIRNGTEYEIKDTTYTAGTGISIDSNNVISNTQTSAEW